ALQKGNMQTMTQEKATSRRGSQDKNLIVGAQVARKVEAVPERKTAGLREPKVGVEFRLSANGASSVSVAGSFNGWEKAPLKKEGDRWTTRLNLARGRYEYRFVVDGKWVSDPNAKESVGNPY